MYSTCKFNYSCCSDMVYCHLHVWIFPLTSFTLLLPDIQDFFIYFQHSFPGGVSNIHITLEQEKSCLLYGWACLL